MEKRFRSRTARRYARVSSASSAIRCRNTFTRSSSSTALAPSAKGAAATGKTMGMTGSVESDRNFLGQVIRGAFADAPIVRAGPLHMITEPRHAYVDVRQGARRAY